MMRAGTVLGLIAVLALAGCNVVKPGNPDVTYPSESPSEPADGPPPYEPLEEGEVCEVVEALTLASFFHPKDVAKIKADALGAESCRWQQRTDEDVRVVTVSVDESDDEDYWNTRAREIFKEHLEKSFLPVKGVGDDAALTLGSTTDGPELHVLDKNRVVSISAQILSHISQPHRFQPLSDNEKALMRIAEAATGDSNDSDATAPGWQDDDIQSIPDICERFDLKGWQPDDEQLPWDFDGEHVNRCNLITDADDESDTIDVGIDVIAPSAFTGETASDMADWWLEQPDFPETPLEGVGDAAVYKYDDFSAKHHKLWATAVVRVQNVVTEVHITVETGEASDPKKAIAKYAGAIVDELEAASR